VGVVLRARHAPELPGRYQLAHQDVAAPLDALSSVVRELHRTLVEPDAVAEDGEHGARSQYVGVESALFERVVLRQSGFVHQIHRLFHRIADILVIRRQGKEVVVDFLYIIAKYLKYK